MEYQSSLTRNLRLKQFSSIHFTLPNCQLLIQVILGINCRTTRIMKLFYMLQSLRTACIRQRLFFAKGVFFNKISPSEVITVCIFFALSPFSLARIELLLVVTSIIKNLTKNVTTYSYVILITSWMLVRYAVCVYK